jgi:hypothetical protein
MILKRKMFYLHETTSQHSQKKTTSRQLCVSNTNIISPTSYKAQDIFAYAAYEAINEIINGTIYSNNELNSL